MDSSVTLVCVIYFKYISTDWRYVIMFSTVLQILAFFNLTAQDETPKFLLATGKFDKARKVLTNIGRTNGVLLGSETYQKTFKQELQ